MIHHLFIVLPNLHVFYSPHYFLFQCVMKESDKLNKRKLVGAHGLFLEHMDYF
jgi:hypothetical protein